MEEKRPWGFPPREFEAKTGLSGIRGGWILPDWIADVPAATVFALEGAALAEVWAWLVERNPSLPKAPENLKGWAMGVLSDINLNDVQFWCSQSQAQHGRRGFGIENRIAAKTGTRPEWRISRETVRLIERAARAQLAKVRASATARAVKEWVGATPDSVPPPHVERRIFDNHGGRCHISGREIRPGDVWHCEHIKSLRAGGLNRETNLAPALVEPHKVKSKRERKLGAKADRIRDKHISGRKAKTQPMPGSRASGWRKPMNGPAERRP